MLIHQQDMPLPSATHINLHFPKLYKLYKVFRGVTGQFKYLIIRPLLHQNSFTITNFANKKRKLHWVISLAKVFKY